MENNNLVEANTLLLGQAYSVQAGKLIRAGFRGNGCGTSPWNIFIGRVLQFMVRVDFKPACVIHDAEQNITKKCDKHRRTSNSNFEANMIRACSTPPTKKQLKLVSWFHGLVILNSSKVYWAKK